MGKARAQLWQLTRIKQKRLILASIIVAEVLFFVEIIAGFFAHSASLLVDAIGTADMSPDKDPFGKKKIPAHLERMGALLGSLFMVSLCAGALGYGIWNISKGVIPNVVIMASVAGAGLVANGITAVLLYRNRIGNPEARTASITARNEALGNLCVVAAAGGVLVSDSSWPDLVATAVLVPFSLRHAYTLFRRLLHIWAATKAEKRSIKTFDKSDMKSPQNRR